MGYLPGTRSKKVQGVVFKTSIRKKIAFFTKKKIVNNAIGSYCFLIVGTGNENKQFYLWSLSLISRVEIEDEEYTGSGPGFCFARPILLNDLPDYADFKHFCGNFGIGFQNITNHNFCKTLIEFAAINAFYGK